jgi:homoserine kinase
VSGELVVRAPASTANLGPGFDCAAAALDLWNELELFAAADGGPLVEIEGEGESELPRDRDHLALRAFALVAPLEGYRFVFRNRIPLERGLGSSAASVAAGLVAGCAAAGHNLSADQLLALGAPLEGHADNLAAALHGGACLSWKAGERLCSRRVATTLPLQAIVVVPEGRVNTSQSRSRLPAFLSHEEAVAAACASALLGAAIASGDAELLAASFHDRLHEPFRIPDAPLLEALRAQPAAGSAGSTLSGSGPSVVVWASEQAAASVAAELGERFPEARVLPLSLAAHGALASRGPAPTPGDPLTASGAEIGAHA